MRDSYKCHQEQAYETWSREGHSRVAGGKAYPHKGIGDFSDYNITNVS